MAKVQLYKQDQLASSLVGVPQVDNSGAMIAQSILSTTSGLASAQNEIAAQQNYRAQQNVNQGLQGMGQILAQQGYERRVAERRALMEQKAFQKAETLDKADEYASQYGLRQLKEEITARDQGIDNPVQERIDGYSKARLDSRDQFLKENNITDPNILHALAPKLRTLDEQSINRTANLFYNQNTEQAPIRWKNRINDMVTASSQIGASPQSWTSPANIEATLQDYRALRGNLVKANPEMAMGGDEIAAEKHAADKAMATALLTNVNRFAPEQFATVRALPEFSKSIEGGGIFTSKEMEDQDDDNRKYLNIAKAERQEAYKQKLDEQNLEGYNRVAGVNKTDQRQVEEFAKEVDGKLNMARESLKTATEPDARKLLGEQIKDLTQQRDHAIDWTLQNKTRAKQELTEEESKRAKAFREQAIANYNSEDARNVKASISAKYAALPTIAAVRKNGVTGAEKSALLSSIAEYKRSVNEAILKNYYNLPDNQIPTGVIERMGWADELYKEVSGTEPTKPNAVKQWVEDKLKIPPPDVYHLNLNTANDVRLRHQASEQIADSTRGYISEYEALRAKGEKGANGKPLPPVSQNMINDWQRKAMAVHTINAAASQTRSMFNPAAYAMAPAAKTAAPAKGKTKSKTTKSSGLVPPPPPDIPTFDPQEYDEFLKWKAARGK